MTRLANLVLIACVVSVKTISIVKVSDKVNVTKLGTDFFPDWVPFRNKHGNELGEFVSVPKAKLKKRLALPANFILRALAEPEGDDYYDKGQGETDGEDYFEKKEWSDISRPAEAVDTDKPINHTEISEIDGVVNIITNAKPNIVLSTRQLLNNSNKNKKDSEESKESNEDDKEEKRDKSTLPRDSIFKPKEIIVKKYEDDIEYDESNDNKRKPEIIDEEQVENDAKKAKILNSVDELKERHAEEQRVISEKVKEEEIFREEQERNNFGPNQNVGKYNGRDKIKKVLDYEEYDDKDASVHEKYRLRINQSPTTTSKPKRTTKHNNKKQSQGKLSVFKNPQLYIIYDDDVSDEAIPITTQLPPTRKFTRFSSRYLTVTTTEASDPEENVRISLVPQSLGKEGEPALFFPETRKSKRIRKNKTTTPEPDSNVAETVKDSAAKGLPTAKVYTTVQHNSTEFTKGPDTTIKAVTGGGNATLDPEFETDSMKTTLTAEDTVSTNSDAVTDAVPASTDHTEKEKKQENYQKEKGGGREHKSEHFEEHAEHGKKAYEFTTTPTYFLAKDRTQQMLKSKLARAKPWAFMKIRKLPRATTTRKTTSASIPTMEATIRTTTTSRATMATITTKNTGKNKPSMRSQANIPKGIVQREATTSTKKRNTKKKWNSLKKMATLPRMRSMVATTTRRSTKRVATTRKATLRPSTRKSSKARTATSTKTVTRMESRATAPPLVMMNTANTTQQRSTKRVKSQARNGSTTTATQPKLPI